MDDSNRRVVSFLEKEIKTYAALSLFLSKESIAERLRTGNREVLISPAFYKERIKEARELVHELGKSI